MYDAAVPDPRRWKALFLLCAAFFMVVLDVAIVNVALPTIEDKLNFSPDNLQWILTAYSLTFGGFLLLGGRAADLVGRRVVFMTGVAIFTTASLFCGLAQSEAWLITARAVQGFGAALLTPSALSIITTTFTERAERNKALGVWGAVGGGGAAAGVVMGGLLTRYLGWEWIFFVNVPVGILAFLLTRRLVDESRVDVADRQFDIPGAFLVTGGLALLVYAITQAPQVGWGTFRTIGLIVAAVVLLVLFIAWEARAKAPLMPLGFFRDRLMAAANGTSFLLSASLYSNFFVLTLYMQQVLHYSALQAGLAFVATAGTAVLAAGAAQALVTKIGVKPVLLVGLVLLVLASLWYTRLPVDGSYPSDLLIPYIVYGIGIGFAFVPVTIAALAGAPEEEAGLASGLINTSQQIGGAIGLAVVSTVVFTRIGDLLAVGKAPAVASTDGYQRGFWVVALVGAAALLVAIVFIRRDEVTVPDAEPAMEGVEA